MCLALEQVAHSPAYRELGNMTELSKREYYNLAHWKQYKHACAYNLTTGLCHAEWRTNDFPMVSRFSRYLHLLRCRFSVSGLSRGCMWMPVSPRLWAAEVLSSGERYHCAVVGWQLWGPLLKNQCPFVRPAYLAACQLAWSHIMKPDPVTWFLIGCVKVTLWLKSSL